MPNVYVCGSINMDLVSFSDTLPRHGETVMGFRFDEIPGGKGANQAIAAARSGALTYMAGCVGDDGMGRTMLSYLKGASVDCGYVQIAKDNRTGTAVIMVGDGENMITVVPGANACFTAAQDMIDKVASGDLVIAQCETPISVTKEIFQKAKERGARTLFNTAPALKGASELFAFSDFLIMNETEFALYTGKSFDVENAKEAIAQGFTLCHLRKGQGFIVTLGQKGVAFYDGERYMSLPAHSITVVDTTGAGDCFCGSFAARLAMGDDVPTALAYANASAAISIGRAGAGPSMPVAADVLSFLDKNYTSQKAYSHV